MSKIQDVNREVKARILANDAKLMKAVGRNYDALYRQLAKDAKNLAEKIKALKEQGKDPKGALFQLRQYNDMLRQFTVDSNMCYKKTAKLVAAAQAAAIAQGAEDARALTFADMEDRQGDFAYIWNAPDNAAYVNMVGYTEKGSPLIDVLKKHRRLFGRGKIIEALRVGILRGDSPERIGRKMKQLGYDDAKHAQLVARTETMRCYRQSTLDNYEANSDIVEGVIWVCAHQARTCATCWAMDGRLFKLGEDVPNDHPNGRCTYLPKTKDVPGLDTGVKPWEPDKAFDQLTDEEQRRILGPKKYDKYKNQGIPLRSFAQIKQNDIWGSQVTGADPVAPQPTTGTNPGQKPVKAVVPDKMLESMKAQGWTDAGIQEVKDRLARLPEPFRELWNEYVDGELLTDYRKDYTGAHYKPDADGDKYPRGIYNVGADNAGTLIHEAFHMVDDINQQGGRFAHGNCLSNNQELLETIRNEADTWTKEAIKPTKKGESAPKTAEQKKGKFKDAFCEELGIKRWDLHDRKKGRAGLQDIIDGATAGEYLLAYGHSWPECDKWPADYTSRKKVKYWKRWKDERDLPSETFANVADMLSDGGKSAEILTARFPQTVEKITEIVKAKAEELREQKKQQQQQGVST